MSHRKTKASLILSFFLLTSCAALPSGSPAPTPHPEVTVTPTSSPNFAPSSAHPTVAMERPDLTGEWHRTDCHSESSACMTILEQTAEGFTVEAECYYGSHSGTLAPTSARFIGESAAVVERYGYYAEDDEKEEKPPINFIWESDTLTIETEAVDYQLGFGFGVGIQGTYTRGEPEYTNAGQLDCILSQEEQKRLRDVVADYDWSVAQILENGTIDEDVPCLLADGRKGRYLSAWHSPNWGYTLEVVLAEDGKTYFQGNVGFYTDDTGATELPQVVWPIKDDTHDAFEVPTGGQLGTVLVTVELGEYGENQFSVWTKDNLDTPLQIMTAEGTRVLPWSDVVDANFDGYTDFGYVTSVGISGWYNSNYWLWNEEQRKFILEPCFAEILNPQFEEKTKTISSRYMGPNYESISFYRWEGPELICTRMICFAKEIDWGRDQDQKNQWVWTVEDYIEGKLVEIHRETLDVPEDCFFPMDIYLDEKWYDLAYHGE